VVHFRDGKISEYWYQPWDQAGVDAWFGRQATAPRPGLEIS
jgi:hypothetical protein